MRLLVSAVTLTVVALTPLSAVASGSAQAPAQTAPKTQAPPKSQTPAPPKSSTAPAKASTPPAKAAAPAAKPAAKTTEPAKPEAPPVTRPSLAELRREVETRRAEVTRLQEAPLPGDDEVRKHREAKATLEETLAQHEARVQQAEPKLPGWRKERADLKAIAKPSSKQAARIQELDVLIAEAERIVAEARGDAAAVRAKIRQVDADIAKVAGRQTGARRDQEMAEQALRNAEAALASEEKRAQAYLALYDVAVRVRTFDSTLKASKPPFEPVKFDEESNAKVADQVAQEQKAVENGRYAYDMNGLKRHLQTEGAKFFATAKQTANRKPLSGPPAKVAPARARTVKDIDALQKAWTQALGKPMPEPNDLAPLLDRTQTALRDLK